LIDFTQLNSYRYNKCHNSYLGTLFPNSLTGASTYLLTLGISSTKHKWVCVLPKDFVREVTLDQKSQNKLGIYIGWKNKILITSMLIIELIEIRDSTIIEHFTKYNSHNSDM